MFTKSQPKLIPENVIYFRSRQSTFVLPEDPSNEELAFDWTLSKEDKVQVFKRRGDNNRRRFAVQLRILRKYGRFLEDYRSISTKIIGYLSSQLEIEPIISLPDSCRESTETGYRRDICEYLGYTDLDNIVELELEKWVMSVISEDYFAENLLPKAEEFLSNKKVVLHSPLQMERIINSVYTKAEEKLLSMITATLTTEIKTAIDKLLDMDKGRNKTIFFKFSEYPPEPKAQKIAQYFKLYKKLELVNITKEHFANISPNLVKALASAVKSYDAYRIRRFSETKKYALAACYLFCTKQSMLDNLSYMHIRFISTIDREAKNIYESKHRKLRKKMKKGIKTLESFAKLYLSFERNTPVYRIDEQISQAKIMAAVDCCQEYKRLEENGKIDILQGKYPNFKRYFPLFLTLNFQAEKGAQYLLDAISIVRQYHTGAIKKIPRDVSTDFVPKNWRKSLINQDDEINPRTWEISLGFAIRDALNSGDLFIPESVHYISFWNMVYNEKRWNSDREKIYTEQGFQKDCNFVTSQLTNKLESTADTAIKKLSDNKFIKIKNGKVRFAKDDPNPESVEVKSLRHLIESDLPKIRIEQLLMEVDALCGFSKEIMPFGGFKNLHKKLPERFAALVAQGTNLGIHTMAESASGISVDGLQSISKACMRVDSLKAANNILVNYQKNLEMSDVYGQGKKSSSDGQRFGVNKGSLITSMYPRYFGYYDKAVTVYTHVSDQYSVFASQIISCGENEALYVLDGLLDNQSSLEIEKHHTDTGGYTDHVFVLSFLLGFSYMPRLKNLHKRRLYKIDKYSSYGPLEPLFKGTINLALIKELWDTMIRVVASFKNKIVPARVIMRRLSSSAPADRLSKALTELGRLLKTNYILNYIQDDEIRRQVHKQLNLGEHRHAVAKYIFFADRGEFRTGDINEIMNKVSCLSILSNAILVWNTVHISGIVKKLRQNGYIIKDKDLSRVSPMMHKHVFVNGTYDFSKREPIVMQ
jgi:TnpA family transposase